MTTTQIPVLIPREVINHVAEIGMQAVFSDILDNLPAVFPDATKVECELDPGIEDDCDPMVIFLITIPDKAPSNPTPFIKWSNWALNRHTGRELYHFTVLFVHEP